MKTKPLMKYTRSISHNESNTYEIRLEMCVQEMFNADDDDDDVITPFATAVETTTDRRTIGPI